MTVVLVTLEGSGSRSYPGMAAVIDTDSPARRRYRFADAHLCRHGGLVGGMARDPEGGLWLTLREAVVQVEPGSLTVTAAFVHPLFGDLHQLCWWRGMLLVVCTESGVVAALDPKTGAVDVAFRLPHGKAHHANSISIDQDGSLLVTCHGMGLWGGIWRYDGRDLEPVWTEHAGFRLRQPHDGMTVDGALLCAESGNGRLLWKDGHALELGGWCRGVVRVGEHLVVGVNRFQEPRRRGTVFRAELAVIGGRREVIERMPLGVDPPLQTFAILPAERGDLGWDGGAGATG